MRHNPPFEVRPWLADERERAARIGAPLECGHCDAEGGEPACLASEVCEDCGAIGDHREGCAHG